MREEIGKMELTNKINRNYHKFNESEKQIIHYLKSRHFQIKEMNAQSLAKESFVSRTTIFRFLKKLDIDSFAEFKYLLAKENSQPVKENSQIFDVISGYHNYIDQVYTKLKLKPIISLLKQSQTLYLFGTGNEQKLEVEYMRQLFTSIGKKVIVIFDLGEFDYAKGLFQPGDLFILLSYKGDSPECVQMINEAKVSNIQTLAITRTSHNLMSQVAHHQLYVPTESINTATRLTYEISTTFYFLIDQLFLGCLES